MRTLVQALGTASLNAPSLLVGWLLALLSPAVIEEIRRRYRIKRLRKALDNELHELQFLMAIRAFTFRQRSGLYTDEFLDWLEPILHAYRGSEPKGSFSDVVTAMRKVAEGERPKIRASNGLALTALEVALLSVHKNEITLFSVEEQTFLLKVIKRVGYYNDHVQYSRTLFLKTFENVSPINLEVLRRAIEDSYSNLGQQAYWIADLIKSTPPKFHV